MSLFAQTEKDKGLLLKDNKSVVVKKGLSLIGIALLLPYGLIVAHIPV